MSLELYNELKKNEEKTKHIYDMCERLFEANINVEGTVGTEIYQIWQTEKQNRKADEEYIAQQNDKKIKNRTILKKALEKLTSDELKVLKNTIELEYKIRKDYYYIHDQGYIQGLVDYLWRTDCELP